MKLFGQTKDGAIDTLLRAYVSRPRNPHQACQEFDPDRANAYIERSLTSVSRLHYEAHLSECAACRKNVVALARLADADTLTSVVPAREATRSTWFPGVKQIFGAMSQPQWAMAATAVIVLAVSLPLLLSRNQDRDSTSAIAERNTPESAAAAAPAANSTSGESAPALAMSAKQRERSDDKNEILATKAPAASNIADAHAGVESGAAFAKKQEAKGANQPADDQRKSAGLVAPAQGGAAPESQVGKTDSDQNRQQQPEKDSAQQATEPKTAARTDEERAKEKTDRAEDVAAPPAPASTSEVAGGRAALRRPGKLSLRDSRGEAVRPEERRISNKKFLFRDGAWTDKDFDPDKDLPVVTLIRDSNVYKELISKRAGLRSIMERFTPAERAIIVYKGTVYKLIPQ